MTDQRKWMPIREFVKLGKEAVRAYKSGDKARIEEVNNRLAEIGYEVFQQDGKVYIKNKGSEN